VSTSGGLLRHEASRVRVSQFSLDLKMNGQDFIKTKSYLASILGR
jgi:hypothetical protein